MVLPMEAQMVSFGLAVGTVGFAALLLVAVGYMLRVAWRALGGSDAGETPVPTSRRPSGYVAHHDGRDHDRALLALQADQRRAEFRRRCEAAAADRAQAARLDPGCDVRDPASLSVN